MAPHELIGTYAPATGHYSSDELVEHVRQELERVRETGARKDVLPEESSSLSAGQEELVDVLVKKRLRLFRGSREEIQALGEARDALSHEWDSDALVKRFQDLVEDVMGALLNKSRGSRSA